MIFDPAAMAHADAYRLIVGAVVPRPIAFVSSRATDGVTNLAPFSFFTVVCSNPLTIAFSPMRKGPQALKKDTLANIEATGEFVVNMVDEAIVGPMNACSAEFAPEVCEFAISGLTPVPSEVVAVPRVAESPIQLECKLHQVVEISDQPGGGALVIGTVVRLHVRDELLQDGKIVMERWQPVGRAAGATYVRCTDTFELARPTSAVVPQSVR